MGTLIIPDLDEATARSLREQALRHGRSVEEEARVILGEALPKAEPAVLDNLYDAFRAIVAETGPIDLAPPPRMPWREPPDFDA